MKTPDNKGQKLVLSEAEIRELYRVLLTRFSYMALAMSENIEAEIKYLCELIDEDSSVLSLDCFGRLNN